MIIMCQFEPDVVCITETWWSTKVGDQEIALTSFQLFRKDRIGYQVGGVLIYDRQGLLVSDKSENLAGNTEAIWLTVSTPGSQALDILMVYRPPSRNQQSDTSLMKKVRAIAKRPDVMIMGDLSAPHIDWNLSSVPGSEVTFDL
ncbi:unnamed protein product [Dibothriocephalus latus]|uniref:Endonuclease/exonuclease/phosphatase domain-containing protein n=1 Tax=Dibothriocephalus latus TaxID=60516 RepID=A0A3P7MP13_DIBLA|nr:unnamed protein product [Dibothriocephalus latus]